MFHVSAKAHLPLKARSGPEEVPSSSHTAGEVGSSVATLGAPHLPDLSCGEALVDFSTYFLYFNTHFIWEETLMS